MRYAPFQALLALALLSAPQVLQAQTGPQPGNCSTGTAQNDLAVNNVFARVFNTGTLFYGNDTESTGYVVPASSGVGSVYAAGLWVGGRVGGELRVAGGTYGAAPGMDYNYWPGPLNDDGSAPADCSVFDRIYSVSRTDISNAEAGNPTGDVADWPVELGAPVIDGDGVAGNYNFAGGDRPDIIGSQALFWVTNDVGNDHGTAATPPLGIEVRTLAFSFSRADALGSTTFYRYTIINKGGATIEDTYVSIFVDPDLGDFEDDYVGSDAALGLGYVYNSVNEDDQFGTAPPAVGFDFFQGPIVPDGNDAGSDPDTLGTSAFSYFQNSAPAGEGDPDNGVEIYNYQQGLWADGTTMRAYGDGYRETQGEETVFAFPGDPVTDQTWSEVNPGAGAPNNIAGDRRFAIHTGPFTLNNRDSQDIVFGIVYGRGSTNIGSITALRAADQLAQAAYDANFALAPPPPAPPLCQEGSVVLAPGSGSCLDAVELDGQATLVWGYPNIGDPRATNYLGQFEQFDALLAGQGLADSTYNFEGFNVYRYPNSQFDDDERELVQTYDVINGVTTVRDISFDAELGADREFVTARGTDSGVRFFYNIPNLTNFQDVYYGVSAYSYSVNSIPKVIESQVNKITVRPSRLTSGAQTQAETGTAVTVTPGQRGGANPVSVRIVDPTAITGDTYEIEFYTLPGTPTGALTYDVRNTTDGTLILDGREYFARTGLLLPIGENVTVADGITFDLRTTGTAGFRTFLTTANASGSLAPDSLEYASTSALTGSPFIPGQTVSDTGPTERQQVGPARWLIQQGTDLAAGTARTYRSAQPNRGFFNVITRNGDNFGIIGSSDYEWRFTGGNSLAFTSPDGSGSLTVPFEIWDVGDPLIAADDLRLIPRIGPNNTANVFDLGTGSPASLFDHPIDGAANDPFTDRLFWHQPTDLTPGQAGYNAYSAGGAVNVSAIGAEIFANMVLVNLNGGTVTAGVYNQALPETGTIFQIVTADVLKAGDSFTVNTSGLGVRVASAEEAESALDLIAAVPNPYMGTSNYETGNLSRVIRFTNLPDQPLTIRIYTVSGSLVRELPKDDSARSLDWNLETSNSLPVASGMYLAHIEVDGVGERVLKLGIINRRPRISTF